MLQELTWPTQMLKRCQKSCYNNRRWWIHFSLKGTVLLFFCSYPPPWKLRCPLKIDAWKMFCFFLNIDGWMNVCWKRDRFWKEMNHRLQPSMFRGYVRFQWCKEWPKEKLVSHAKMLVCRRVGEIYIYYIQRCIIVTLYLLCTHMLPLHYTETINDISSRKQTQRVSYLIGG